MKVDNNYIVLRSINLPILVIDVEKDDLVAATDSAIAVSDIFPARKKISLKDLVVMCLYALVIVHMKNCGQRGCKMDSLLTVN
jgi:hypothetical protein